MREVGYLRRLEDLEVLRGVPEALKALRKAGYKLVLLPYVVETILDLRTRYPKLRMPKGMVEVYLKPPATPDECTFAKTTLCVSSDLQRRITPCQFGGNPDCANCGCIASAGLKAVGRHRLPMGIPVGAIFEGSFRVGHAVKRLRGGGSQTAAPLHRQAVGQPGDR